jgi:hypothetical protein
MLIPTVDALALNRVVGLGGFAPATETQLDRVVELSRASGVPRLFIQVPPTAAPAMLPEWLQKRNARPYNRWVRLRHDPRAPLRETPDTELRVSESGREHARAFAGVVQQSYGFPPAVGEWTTAAMGRPGWTHYGAWDGDELVATGAVFVARQTGWLGFAATKESHRRRGAQSVLIAERCRKAATLGCDGVITDTAEDRPERPAASYRNLVRLGFAEAYRRENYVLVLAE